MKRKGRTDQSEYRAAVRSLPPEGRSRLLHPRAIDALLLLANGRAGEEIRSVRRVLRVQRDDDRPTQQAG